jgi:glyceraldehyde-3-phosphate dehydrogenase (NADP+)
MDGSQEGMKGLRDIFVSAEEIPDKHRLGQPVNQNYYLVGGELREWSGPMQTMYSPVYLRKGDKLVPVVVGSYPSLTAKESLEALDVAVKAYDEGRGIWPTMSVTQRCRYLMGFAARISEVRGEIVRLLMWEIGKNLKDSEKEFDRTVQYILDTVDATMNLSRTSAELIEADGVVGQIRRSPLGVVLCMGPFNYPLNETFTTLIPALIMGNTVIMKPPKLGVLLHYPLLKIFKEVFPAGVVNTIYGDGRTIVSPLIASGKIDILAFIGSSKVADSLKAQSPNPHRLRSVLGLEAKNPAIILPDAEMDVVISECLAGSLSFNGQRCTALKIIFVHSTLAVEFTARFAEAVDGLKLGMPWEEGVSITPLPEDHKASAMNELLVDAKILGALIINRHGGKFLESLMVPAVVFPVKPGMRLYVEEQFGPIVPIVVYNEVEEVLSYIRQSRFGQQVSIFGRDEQIIGRLIDQLANQVCRINLNCQCQRGPDIFPFAGRKDSAEGTLSVSDALRVFSIRSMVATNAVPANREVFDGIRQKGLSEFLSMK